MKFVMKKSSKKLLNALQDSIVANATRLGRKIFLQVGSGDDCAFTVEAFDAAGFNP